MKSSSSKNKKTKSGLSELNAALTMTGGAQFALQPHSSHDPDETKENVKKQLKLMGMLPKGSSGNLSKEALQAMSFKRLLYRVLIDTLVKFDHVISAIHGVRVC